MQADVREGRSPRVTKGDRTRQAMINATLDLLDESGLQSITLQTLGDRLGMHPTSMYRYFTNVEDLLGASLASLLDDLGAGLQLPDEPRDRLAAIALAVRALFHRRPGAAALLVSEAGEELVAPALVTPVLESLRAMGIAEPQVAIAYQAFETHVLGTTLFDFAGAPNHLESRGRRHLAVGDDALDRASDSAAAVDKVNEEAYLLGLEALLDRLVNQKP